MSVILFCLAPVPPSPDGLFEISVVVRSTQDRLTGLDFDFAPSGALLVYRDLAGSSFPDAVSAGLGGDLGGSVADVAQSLPAGEHPVGKFGFRVEGAGERPITITLTPRAYPGTVGYVTEAPGFAERPFDGFAGVSVQIPEPAGALALLLGLAWARRRRHTCRS